MHDAKGVYHFRILLVVPVVYMLLNTPFYLLRITDTIALYVFQSNEFSIVGGLDGTLTIFLYNTAHYLYYINFACDVIVYAFSRLVHSLVMLQNFIQLMHL